MVQEREIEIREIETGIHELNEITRDLATIITEQGTMIGEPSFISHFPLTATSVPFRPIPLDELSLSSEIDRFAHRQHRIEHLIRRS